MTDTQKRLHLVDFIGDKMKISFPNDKESDNDLKKVFFQAVVEISCSISKDALRDHFKGTDIEAFKSNRNKIEEIARRLITQRRFETDGSIYIKSSDCDLD